MGCDQTVQIPQPLALHNSPCGLSGTKEMLPQARVKIPFQKENRAKQYFNNNNKRALLCVLLILWGLSSSFCTGDFHKGLSPAPSFRAACIIITFCSPFSPWEADSCPVFHSQLLKLEAEEVRHQRILKQEWALRMIKATPELKLDQKKGRIQKQRVCTPLSPSCNDNVGWMGKGAHIHVSFIHSSIY